MVKMSSELVMLAHTGMLMCAQRRSSCSYMPNPSRFGPDTRPKAKLIIQISPHGNGFLSLGKWKIKHSSLG